MAIWEAIILGIIQGLTEFLPVSSSGHVLLAERLLGIKGDLSFTLMLHLATLLAVVVVLRKKLWETIKTPKKWLPLIVATSFSAVVVLLFHNLIEATFDGRFLAVSFLITAVLLLASSFVKPRKTEINCFDAVFIGLMQGLAALPGISRSGSTISTATLLGNSKEQSVEFSFLLSIPIIAGSALIDVITEGLGTVEFLPLIFGFVAAFLSGLFAIKLMLKLIKGSNDFFAVYLTVLSAFLLINDLWLHLF